MTGLLPFNFQLRDLKLFLNGNSCQFEMTFDLDHEVQMFGKVKREIEFVYWAGMSQFAQVGSDWPKDGQIWVKTTITPTI